MKLRDLAHARSGDKGDTSNISVIAYREADYPLLAQHVTAARVKLLFAGVVQGEVVRHELPGLGALNFVMHRALGGGVTRTLALDIHGKCLASALLDLELPVTAPPTRSAYASECEPSSPSDDTACDTRPA